MPQIIELPPSFLPASIREGSFNEADNTIECVWTTGATVRRRSWIDGPYDEELVVSGNAVRLGRLNAGAPLLDTHMAYSVSNVLGAVVAGSARLIGGEGIARIALSKAPGDADAVTKIRDRTVRNMSTGYIIHAVEKTEREGKVPLWRVIDWEPYELTACPIGADAGAQFRTADKVRTYPCTVAGASAAEVARLRLQLARRRRLATA